jgi:MurNAc alpha-1-phosphate uridylyltransferase
MILAAGRGARMRPLTDHTPKPLLEVAGKPLIVWQVERLVAGGFTDLVINHAWLGERLEDTLGDGSRFGARIAWSREATALETAGGIVTALPLLEDGARDRPFAVVSADIYTTFDYARLAPHVASIDARFPLRTAHLVATANPDFHPNGDFAIEDGLVRRDGEPRLTYANIGVFHPRAFDDLAAHAVLRLFPWAFAFADVGRMTGEVFDGIWHNVGTPEQLATLDRALTIA